MVLSTSKRTSSIASIVNQNSGGGSKKAGLPFQIGRESSVSRAFRKTSQYLFLLRGKRYQLEYLLANAIMILAKLTEIKTAADALVTSIVATVKGLNSSSTVTVNSNEADVDELISSATTKISTKKEAYDIATAADPLVESAVTQTKKEYDDAVAEKAALLALKDAVIAAAAADTNVGTATTNKSTAESNLTAYTAPI